MGKNIKIELLKLGITQRELADFLGFNESYISLLISGKRKNKTFSDWVKKVLKIDLSKGGNK
ncbi:MAG: helix-turn-helix transcriptional regulator [Candidatus Gastranaerophilales bacterium]|nr:helix-turn-helix transcriptional regulator [Candidatus Gastranaerophilales bacterium]